MKKLFNLFTAKLICFILINSFSTSNLVAQTKILNRHCPDYPAGTICSECDADDTCTTFILPPARYNQPYTVIIPLLVPDPDICEINTIVCGNTEIADNHTLTNNCNEINLLVTSWDSWSEENWIRFNFHVNKTGDYADENQVYTIPLIRDTAKIVLVLDISESMASNIEGTTNTRIDELKDAVNYLAPHFEQIRQEGDSIGVTYYNSEVIQPDSINFPKDFIEITDWSGAPENFSSTKINNDLATRMPGGMAAMGEGLLDAKNKLKKDTSTNFRKIVFLFSDGLQNTGNQLNLDGISYVNSPDSLNNSAVNSNDSIIYITVSTSKAADIPPIMSAIAHKNNGTSLHIDGSSTEFEFFLNNQLDNILHGNNPQEIATRIIGLNPFNDSIKIDFTQNLILSFNEDVVVNTGKVYIKRYTDDSIFEEIDVTSGLITGDSTSTITINPSSNFESETEYYVLIDENAFKGKSGNNFAGITSNDYWTFTTEDILSPSVIISTLENNPTNSTPFEITIEFSEEITGFDVGDISAINGTASNLNTSNDTIFTADITPIADGLITINIDSDVAVDNAGNPNTGSNILEINFDSTAPSVSISTLEDNPTNSNPFEITIEFNEEITGFDVGDISVINGATNNLSTSDSTTFTADITPTADGLVTINIESGVVVDNAGNPNTESNVLEINFDSTTLSVSISTLEYNPTNSNPFEITIEFSEEITGFDVEEISVVNGTASNLSTSDSTTFTADITPTAEGLITININSDVAVDNAGNPNTGSNVLEINFDSTLPSVSLSTMEDNPTNSNLFEITIEFSEKVTGFDVGDISVVNGTASNLNTSNDTIFTADITPTADGLITININSGVVVDNAGNPNTGSNILEINFDSTLPSVSLSTMEDNPTNSNLFEITIEFSEEITGFDVGDISVVSGAASNLNTSNDTIFTADITPTAEGLITINIDSDVAVDNAGNQNTGSNMLEINFDSTLPSVSLSTIEDNPTNSNLFEITIEFSEKVTGFDVGDISVVNGTASNLNTSNDTIFTADITPTADGLITININSGVVVDNAGNSNTGSNMLEINFDSTRPSVSLSADNDTTTTAQFNTYVNFSERVIGFNASKINVTNGNINLLATSDSIDYVATITAITQGEIDINIDENQVSDSAGNMNTASDELTVTYYVPTNIEVLKKDGISIYSNNGFVIVEFLNPHTLNFQSGYIEIYSLNGSLIKKENIERNSLFKTYVNDQREIYLVKLTLDKNIYYTKIQN
ncbi:MAG: hypothetical protein KAT68_19060 [Bacteroidales bacterium]|nr:hypothetical protein [Bacteroidales bacterium]